LKNATRQQRLERAKAEPRAKINAHREQIQKKDN
jgi:hypothetical protein